MKACIVTVYNSTNCGSFLQAYSLKYTLEQLGAEVTFLKTGVKNNRNIMIDKSLRYLKMGKPRRIAPEYRKYRNFEDCLKRFRLCRMNEKELAAQDIFVLGSDEIWNVSREIIRKADIFWGCGLEGNIISYAPSVNTATEDDMAGAPYVELALQCMNRISVRDSYSKQLISKYTDKPVEILCDPTFLLPMEEYDAIEGSCPFEDFILVYSTAARFTDEDKKALKEFAKSRGKKLVAFPHDLKWCDAHGQVHPLDAIAYFKKADCVITDTFHGTALSLIFNKDFLALPRGNTKVSELLNFFELPQLMRDSAAGVDEYFRSTSYSREKLNERIAREREKAVNYLKEAMGV